MPTFPKVRNAHRTVRAVEVAREMEPKHKTKANRHIRIRREVKVNLEHVGDCAPPCIEDTRSICGKNAVCNNPHLVREENLFGKAKAEEHNAAHKVFERMRTGFKFFGHGIVSHNRTRHKLRKKRHVASESREVLDRRSGAAINVNRITHRLERVERNTHRQKNGHDRKRFTAKHRRKIVHDSHAEHIILEEAERTEVHADGSPQGHLPLQRTCVGRRDKTPRHVHHQGAAEHQEDEPRLQPPVKDVAENGDEEVQERMFSPELEEYKIANEERRQEVEKENLGRKDHGLVRSRK